MLHFTSDSHWSHRNIISYSNRPFSTVEEMDQALIDNINRNVKETDTLVHLGDWSFGNWRNIEKFRKQINCQRIIICLGNHDYELRKRTELHSLFTQVCDYKMIRYEGQKIACGHYAMRIWEDSHKGAWNLYGHSHSTLAEELNSLSLDVGVDNPITQFSPISFDFLKEYMKRKRFEPVDHHNEHTT